MTKKNDLILYPFLVDKIEDLDLHFNEGRYEIHFNDGISTHKIKSVKKTGLNYYEIEITDGKCEVINIYDTLHHFTCPADFIGKNESESFYSDLNNTLLHGSIDEICEKGNLMEQNNESFPEFFCPAISTAFNMGNNYVCPRAYTPITTISKAEFPNIINQPSEEIIKAINKNFSENIVKEGSKFFKNYFDKNPISRMRDLIKEFKKYKFEYFKENHLKSFVPMFGFTYRKGPWRHCLIKYGVNVANDRNNYKYQILSLFGKSINFQIKDCPEIMTEIESKKDVYLLDEINIKYGYFKESMQYLIQYYAKNSKKFQELIEEEDENDEFEIFD